MLSQLHEFSILIHPEKNKVMKTKANVQYLNVIVKENLTFVHSSFMIFYFLIIFVPTSFSFIKNGILRKELLAYGM